MIGHKQITANLKIEIIPTIFSDHNGMKLEISKRETEQPLSQRNQMRNKKLPLHKWKYNILKLTVCTKCISKKISNKQPNFTPLGT